MPLSAVERQAYYNAIETSGMESDIAKATLRARIENIDMSLQELGETMNISKSGIRNRFRRIEEIYNNLEEDIKH